MSGTGAKEGGSIANKLFAELNCIVLVAPDQFQKFCSAFDKGLVQHGFAVEVQKVEGVED
jgi:hypothetical protein